MSKPAPAFAPGFSLVQQQAIPSLNIEVQEFIHDATGAQHIHLAADNEENVFLVALRTVPHDSTGVAHILEHTALCGSQKFPVRDPFFMMTRRSINTFMNAFTSSDWTAYPFASLNRKDFDNLLDVYLDAVFFSRLDPLDFAQEGHRFEFSDPKDTHSPLQYKGVVFNEMKGAMSSVPSQLWQTMSKYLNPTNTYHHNSGGEPSCIPDLSYDELVAFYREHYHPSNAIFMTFGDIPAIEHQEKFEANVLKHFEKLNHQIDVEDEKRYFAPVRVEEAYPCEDEDLSEKTHVTLGWLLGKSIDLETSLKTQLLSSVLLDNSATPLMQALETSDIGSGPSPLCGLESSQKEMIFICGLEGCETGAADAVEALILDTLNKVADEGIPKNEIEAALHQLELRQREIGGDSYPYGLQLILSSLSMATHRGNPAALLNIDATLEKIRAEIQSPDFIKSLIKELLLDNPHQVRLTMRPDAHLSQRKDAAEQATLERIQKTLTETEKQKIVDLAEKLKARQELVENEEILPKVTLEDVPTKESQVDSRSYQHDSTPVTEFAQGTNGLVYQQFIYDLPQLTSDQLALLPLYSNCVTEVGFENKNYLDVQKLQAQYTGGVSAFSSIRCHVSDPHATSSAFTFSGKALQRHHKTLTEIMESTIGGVHFKEHDRIRDLIAQIRSHREQSLTNSGHSLAMVAACAGMNSAAKLAHTNGGLASIQWIKALDQAIKDTDKLEQLCQALEALHGQITAQSRQALLIGEEAALETCRANFDILSANTPSPSQFSLDKQEANVQEAWLTNSQVNFCAKAYKTVSLTHEDAPILTVLAGFLRNGFLHKTIREQGGAYGGGASQNNNLGCFRFYSYRDPRLEDTLSDFDQSIRWLLNSEHSWQKVEEAILGTISSLDSSESPAGRAKSQFHAELHGRNLAIRQQFREGVLATNLDKLRSVANKYFSPEHANTAVLTGHNMKDSVEKLGLHIHTI